MCASGCASSRDSCMIGTRPYDVRHSFVSLLKHEGGSRVEVARHRAPRPRSRSAPMPTCSRSSIPCRRRPERASRRPAPPRPLSPHRSASARRCTGTDARRTPPRRAGAAWRRFSHRRQVSSRRRAQPRRMSHAGDRTSIELDLPQLPNKAGSRSTTARQAACLGSITSKWSAPSSSTSSASAPAART